MLVAHVDTGVDGSRPALADRIGHFAHVAPDGRVLAGPAFDSGRHGTHTAGLICGGDVDGLRVGVAPDARLHCVAAVDAHRNIARVVRGLWSLRGCGARVLFLPIGAPGHNPVLYPFLRLLRAEGMLPICPIGNVGRTRFLAPGVYDLVLAVGALDRWGRPAAISGSVPADTDGVCRKPELLAPGEDVPSTGADGVRHTMDGTSQASAIVAGAAALLFGAAPYARPDEVEDALLAGARPGGPEDLERSRSGRLDVGRSLALLLEGRVPPAVRGRTRTPPPRRYVEAALRSACRDGLDGTVESILIAKQGQAERTDRGLMGGLLDAVLPAGDSHDVAWFPQAGAAILRTSGRATLAVLDRPELWVAALGEQAPDA